MSNNEPQASVKSIMLNNDATAHKIEPPPEEVKEQDAVIPGAEITDPPATDPEPEKVDKVVEEAREEPPDPETESQKDEDEDEDEGEYTQEEWDALPKDEQKRIDDEYKESLKTVEEAETDRQTRITETDTKLKQDRLDFEKQKLDWDKKAAESKKEADKLFQRRTEEFTEATKELEVSEKFKHLKAKGREKAVGPADPLFPEYVPKLMVTQAEAKQLRGNQAQIDALNDRKNATAKTNHDRMADHFNSQTDFINEIRAERAQQAAFHKRATDWGSSVQKTATELGFEAITQDGKWTPEADQIYNELGKAGVLEQDETTPEYRANMVRLIRNSLAATPAIGNTNGQLSVQKLTKAPPGQTLKTSSKNIPRRKRPPKPPNTMGGSGTGSREVQTKRQDNKKILMQNR